MSNLPKNIVICSDGTGNSGIGGRGTNVFKIFEAIDRQWRGDDPANPSLDCQLAFYDDGVGTEDLKWLKIVTGAFGIGLKRNVKQLYVQLARIYQPGDQIYLFGFSRGAFTVRMLAGLVAQCGILKASELSYGKLWQGANSAMSVHRAGYFRKMFARHDPAQRLLSRARDDFAAQFRAEFPVWSPHDDERVRIHFVGVWDTVEAYGFPVEAVAEFWDRFIYPFRFPDTYLSEYVRHACHALSIDDERATFMPVLWQGRNRETKKEETRIEQVWFAGVHANVGGGYPKQGMSLVALNWMMERAHAHGLRFIPEDRTLIADHSDVRDKLYDSRSGLAAYYRYSPRRIDELCKEAQIDQPTIHASVLDRIRSRTEEYAPANVPSKYHVEPPSGAVPERAPEKREQYLEIVQNVIWWRKVCYRLTVIASLAFVYFCWWFRTPHRIPDIGEWSTVSRFVYALVNPPVSLLEWVTPAYFKDGISALRHHPIATLSLGVTVVAIFIISGRLTVKTREMSFRAWRASLPNFQNEIFDAEVQSRWWMAIARWMASWQTTGIYRLWETRLMPALVIGGLSTVIVALFASWLVAAASIAANPAAVATQKLVDAEPVRLQFDTVNSLQATPVELVRGEKYRITVVSRRDWTDNGHPVGPEGVENPSLVQKLTGWLRRDARQPWFVLLGSLDPDGESAFAIGAESEFRAPRDGRLYLYVNHVYGFYWNNGGSAEIRVECLSAVK